MNNICFDGNYILYKNVFTLHKMNRLYGDLWTALDNNIAKYTAMNSWERIFIVSDSNKKSWRQDELTQYKSHRTRLEDVDWDWVFKTFNEWKESVSDKCIVLQKDHIEGDDWITSIVLKMNKAGKSNVIVSSDQDLLQLVNYNINKEKSWMNLQIVDTLGSEMVYIPEGWELWLKEYDNNRNTDIFALDNSYDAMNFFNRIIKNWQYTEVNAYAQLFKKLVMGDKSDNIKSVYEKLTTTGKIQNIGKAGAEKIWNFYKENYGIHFNTTDKTFINDVLKCVEAVNNVEFEDERRRIVAGNIRRNIKLIELHYRHYPEWVLETIIEELNEKI